MTRRLQLAKSKPAGHPFWVPNGRSRISNLTALRLGRLTIWWVG